MTQCAFAFDSSRCTGCKTCELACKDYKNLDATVAYRKVYDYEGGDWKVADDGTCTTTAYVMGQGVSESRTPLAHFFGSE